MAEQEGRHTEVTEIKKQHIYENIVRIDNVQIIDHRIIRIVNRVHEAPLVIQHETEKFIRYIDNLKKAYISSIIKRQKAEKRYSDALAYYELCRREFRAFQEDSNYLIQIGEEFEFAESQIEKSNIELILTRNILDVSERELILHREQLCLFSKKAEHEFIGFLRKTADRCWADMYMCELDCIESDDIPPPQFVYQPELLNNVDEPELINTLRHNEEEFEWDTTFDDHFHTFRIQNESDNTTEYEANIIKNEFGDYNDVSGCHNHEYDEKNKLYSTEPLYDDFLIYKRRCTLVRRMKPKKLIKYFKSIVHGPWEGWEDL